MNAPLGATPPRLLALDFDGVISDSAPESFVVALSTYSELRSSSAFQGHHGIYSGQLAPVPSAIAADPLYAPFVSLMPLGNRAEDFGVALWSLEDRVGLPDQDAYDAFRSQLAAEWLTAFHARFYEIRASLSARDPAGWRALMGPYQKFLSVLRNWKHDTILAIATAKDRRSVDVLLRDYGIDDLFTGDHVLDKETGLQKDAHLQHLHRRTGVSYHEMVFIDDKVNHLDVVSPLGVRCALATWGYNGDREVELARHRGYLICDLDDVEARISG